MATRIGIDVGGTFTDLIFYDDQSGATKITKVLSRPESPAAACLDAVTRTLSAGQIAESEFFLHSTTVGLNALLERRGAKVGLLCTKGFRDTLQLRRGDRKALYDLLWTPPPPLVPRYLRFPISERMLADGSEHTPLATEDVAAAVELFNREGVDSIAVAFLHAWQNPEHELQAEAALRAAGYDGEVSLSHRASSEYREYERTSTVTLDAYIRPQLAAYLNNLQQGLVDLGFAGKTMVSRSGGGAMTFAEATGRTFETIMSGPVAGAEGAAEIARDLALGDLITADVGGTSFDTCVVQNGRPSLMFESQVDGFAIQAPWTDVRSIGAGGGSIAHIDQAGLLQVGPHSAGADPGPACYGRGGGDATVTDAALILGMLGAGELASGVSLDRDKAEHALQQISAELDFSNRKTARGILAIAAVSMANAIREITLERGLDPRQMTLVCFGGAGPLLATLLAKELDMKDILVPPHAGNFSAWGLLGADLTRTASRTSIMPMIPELVPNIIDTIESIATTLFAELGGEAADVGGRELQRELALEMRYFGQEHALTVPVEYNNGKVEATPEALCDAFISAYLRTFGNSLEDPVELVTCRATVRIPLPRRRGADHGDAAQGGVSKSGDAGSGGQKLEAWSFTGECMLDFSLFDRESLTPGDEVNGPAIITEPTTTTYLDAGFTATVAANNCLLIRETE